MTTISTLVILFMTLSSLPRFEMKKGLRCCDSSGTTDAALTKNLEDAKKCDRVGTTYTTHPRKEAHRHNGKRGKDCDFCTIEVFKVPFGGKEELYYMQSCNSFEAADFEIANWDKEKINMHKKMTILSDFGVDLQQKDTTKLKRVCKLHTARSGYFLIIDAKEGVGVEVPPYLLPAAPPSIPVIQKCDKVPAKMACKNGGTCESGSRIGDTYTCKCADGWTGKLCEIPNKCSVAPYPCKNGGECADGSTGASYACTCATGWAGSYCEKQEKCLVDSCNGHGDCEEVANDSYTCNCEYPWGGKDCNKVSLEKVESMICACFDNDCNGESDIIPTKEDWEKASNSWEFK